MFEAVEVGSRLTGEAYEAGVLELRPKLLEAQRELRGSNASIVVVVSGVEGAGKSEVVNRLCEWLDTRGIQTWTFWDETDEMRQRPFYWRFWRALPPRGTIAIMFGSWYTRPIIDRAYGRITEEAFRRELQRIALFERMLARDDVHFAKLWFHLSRKGQAKRIREARKRRKAARKGKKGAPRTGNWKISPLARKFSRNYEAFVRTSELALRSTDTGAAPWRLVEAHDPCHRDLLAGQTVLHTLARAVGQQASPALAGGDAMPEAESGAEGSVRETILDRVDLTLSLDRKPYRKALERAQRRLFDLSWEAYKRGVATVLVFEGWDASGKGGAIRRLTAALDARLFRTVPIAAPTDEERAHHYLWRFWRHIPRDGYIRIFDRSWYGRVLVERVEAFATPQAWRSAYHEINEFEEELARHGTALGKFWIHLGRDEQLQRFEARQATPHKQHKITGEDWRNRDRWDAYAAAVNDMVARTSTSHAPWTLVAGNDKRHARVQIVETVCDRLAARLDG